MISVMGLNHAVLYVRDLKRSLQFYQSVLGFEKIAILSGKMGFLRAAGSQNHHDLGLIEVGQNAPSPPPRAIGLYHLAWEVKQVEDLAKATEVLTELGCFLSATDHGASKSIYARDPDGHEFELTWQIPRKDWGKFEHEAMVAPLDLSAELARYGSN